MQDITEQFYRQSKTASILTNLCRQKNVKLVLPKKIIKSKIVVVGEALGEQEYLKEEYFVGKAGARLDMLLNKANVIRPLIHITNILKVRPPDNKIKRLPEFALSIKDFLPLIKEELQTIQPNIIVALGGLALYHLTGQHEISKYRGSILPCTLVPNLKVIGTFHPSYACRFPELNYTITFDLQKAVEQSKFKEIRTKPWKSHINPTFEEVIHFINKCEGSKYLSYDIETSGYRITRLGLAPNDEEGMSIPFKTKNFRNCWSDNDLNFILQQLKKVWKKKGIIKVAQGGSYDLHYLIPLLGYPAGPLFDTLIAHKLLYAVGKDSRLAVQHDLGFITSTCTDMPFSKDDHKNWEKRNIPADDALSLYNITDVISTLRAAFTLMEALKMRNLADLFCGYIMPLQRALFKAEFDGIATDNIKRSKLYRKAQKASRQLQGKINRSAKCELNVNSFKQVSKYLYEDLKLPKKIKRGTGKTTTDERALNDLYRSTKNPLLKNIIQQRYLTSKVLGNYLNVNKLSKLKRLHTSYGLTASGRLSSAENIALGHGNNLQNIPDPLRDFAVPEKGNVFLNPDLSQAEALVVVYQSQAQRLKHEMVVKGRKIHKIMGEWVFDKIEKYLTTREYHIAKILVHSSNYRVGSLTFAHNAGLKLQQGKIVQAKYARVFPELPKWHGKIISQVHKTRQVSTLFSRTRWFLGRLNEQINKEIVSHISQSIIAEVLNIGLLSLFLIMPKDIKLKLQIHDEIMFELLLKAIEEFSPYIKLHMETLRAMEIEGDVLCIPVSIPEPRNSWMKPK